METKGAKGAKKAAADDSGSGFGKGLFRERGNDYLLIVTNRTKGGKRTKKAAVDDGGSGFGKGLERRGNDYLLIATNRKGK